MIIIHRDIAQKLSHRRRRQQEQLLRRSYSVVVSLTFCDDKVLPLGARASLTDDGLLLMVKAPGQGLAGRCLVSAQNVRHEFVAKDSLYS